MTKKKLWIFAGGGLLVVSIGLLYWFYFSTPVTLPADEQLINDIHQVFPEATVDVIQDKIYADERHAIVPFISERNEYGLSYWVWGKYKWQVASIDLDGEPRVWKIDQRDPSTYHFVWNLSPVDQLSTLQLYLIRDRGYLISDEEEIYNPRVQMEWIASLQESSYGVMPLPEEGVNVLNSLFKGQATQQSSLFFENFSPAQEVFFSWIAKDQLGNEAYPEISVNGSSYTVGDITVDYMLIFSEEQLELPGRK
ncbi:hypothetical protein [Sporosarcina obsidiansis]|uniref:hypothetical protein n=1 Tax=Sporosarcina obsidiansis TaxID=2660748 RepID=UPI00129AFB03|nr:hypothetical protein [Sporosarcina obsidiansis]